MLRKVTAAIVVAVPFMISPLAAQNPVAVVVQNSGASDQVVTITDNVCGVTSYSGVIGADVPVSIAICLDALGLGNITIRADATGSESTYLSISNGQVVDF